MAKTSSNEPREQGQYHCANELHSSLTYTTQVTIYVLLHLQSPDKKQDVQLNLIFR